MHRALAIPELLDIVCTQLERHSRLSIALVCKKWSSVALDALWGQLDSLMPLFMLLGTLKMDDKKWYFERPPLVSDWDRFGKYSGRVRRLAASEETCLFRSIFDDMARTRTSLSILPNLVMLTWDRYIGLAYIFMHAKIRTLVLPLGYPGSYDIRPVIQDIINRMPNITELMLRPEAPLPVMEDIMLELFEGFQHLQKVVVPRFFTTSKMVELLSRKSTLTTLEFTYQELSHITWADMRNFSPKLEDGAFPALFDLSFTAPFANMVAFLERPFFPANLTHFYVHSYDDESIDNFHALLTVIAAGCPQLRMLCVISSACGTGQDRITLDTIAPIRTLSALRSFEIIHHNPVDVTPEQLEDLAKGWPHLEVLILNNEPSRRTGFPHDLTLQSILPFAKYCPNLKRLGLFLDATHIPSVPAYSEELDYGFRRPVLLSMGTSHIGDPGPVAYYLSRLCAHPENLIEIEAGVTVEEEFHPLGHPEHKEEMLHVYEKWGRVCEFLPLLVTLRWEEKMKHKNLVKELQDLRMRNDVLEGNTRLRGTPTKLLAKFF